MATPPPPAIGGRSSTELNPGGSAGAEPDPPSLDIRWLFVPPAVAIGGTLLAHAGFSERGQVAFIALAAAAALAFVALDPQSLRAATSQPLVLAMLGLAALTAASAAWTIGASGDALRWGAVVAGYAGIAACGFVCARRGGAERVALLLLGLAVACGLLGLLGAAIRAEPLAERIGGAWRPGGPFEYPPALGLLGLAATPVSLRLMASGGAPAAIGAGAFAIAAAVLALVSSRALFVLTALLVLAVLAWPERSMGGARPLALAAVAFGVAAGAAADAVAGSYVRPYTDGGPDLPRLAGLALLLVAAVGLWASQRRSFDARGRVAAGLGRRALALGAVPLTLAITAAALTPDSGPAVEPDSGVTHGRVEVWDAALRTAVDGPVEGSGALTFLAASAPEQDPPPSRFAHNVVLENWVELGYGGLVLTLVLVGLSLALVVQSRAGPGFWLLGPGALAYLVASLIDWPWHVPASAALFALILGALAGDSHGRRRPPPGTALPGRGTTFSAWPSGA